MEKKKGDVSISYTISYFTNPDRVETVSAERGESLLDVLRKRQAAPAADCNGTGSCGKCRVRIVEGDVPISGPDRQFLTSQELAQGYCLACRCKVLDHLTVCVPEPGMPIQSVGLEQTPADGDGKRESCQEHPKQAQRQKEYFIAVDLGSTTLAAVLTDREGNVLAQSTAVNSQRAYGADVLSRIQASNEGKRDLLKACICRDLEQMFQTLVCSQQKQIQIQRIAIAANTTMLHLLRGYSCERLGQAPFEPVNLNLECLDYGQLFAPVAGCEDSKVYLLPGMSAFLGADITAGLFSSGFWQTGKQEPAIFIDLGTNGELAYGSRDGFVTASAAAGPAFEGGRLSCGVPGIPGAICNVSYLYHRVRIRTIGQKKPCGICGTGAMEAVAALLSEGQMDADGLLAPELFTNGMELAKREDGSPIFLTQADIREIQMAKAAIRAGLCVLQKRYQEQFDPARQIPVNRILLAGGFGYYLSAETAVSIGLFAPEWKEKIVLCANTSLKGAIAYLTDPSCAQQLEQIRKKNRTIRLEDDADFQTMYMEQMRFPDRAKSSG